MTDDMIERMARAIWTAAKDNAAASWEGHIPEARAAIEAMPIDKYEDALECIVQWSGAYPLDIFPEPDFKRAEELLRAGGISLDAIAASCMRRVVEGVGKIASDALRGGEQ
jgi:hypothetical protein